MIRAVVAITVLLAAVNCHAGVKVIGQGSARNFDPAGIPPSLRPNLEIMKTKCTRCHSMERIVEAITSGVAPISGELFDANRARAYGLKMMRKTGSNLTKQEIVAAVDLMTYLIGQAAQ